MFLRGMMTVLLVLLTVGLLTAFLIYLGHLGGQILSEGGLLTEEEVPMARHVLFAAALTYVAAALSTFLQLLRLILLFGGNRRD